MALEYQHAFSILSRGGGMNEGISLTLQGYYDIFKPLDSVQEFTTILFSIESEIDR